MTVNKELLLNVLTHVKTNPKNYVQPEQDNRAPIESEDLNKLKSLYKVIREI